NCTRRLVTGLVLENNLVLIVEFAGCFHATIFQCGKVGRYGIGGDIKRFLLPAFRNAPVKGAALLQPVKLPEAELYQDINTGNDDQSRPPPPAVKDFRNGR